MKGDFKTMNFEPQMTIEPTDKYEKAKKDIIEALNSIRELNMQQQQQLFCELVCLLNSNSKL